ncbi:MAG: ATP-binding cassette domain-containing protein [Chloroflexi bacterium]|nr:MAG: ATP-binding cassette domain-containing protein [Chloroflexota bacterium]
MAQPILEARNLVKKYENLVAVDEVTFSIGEGEIFGLLGPNGAGKSTTISILTGLFPPDGGTISIVGCDAVSEVEKVKPFIGVVPQDLALYPDLTGRENLRFFGESYGLSGTRLNERSASVLDTVAMTERANDRVRSYSGGMRRRINLAVGLIHNPRLLFLDEPTVGVDPQSRNHIFESVGQLNREQGMSVLYTTHYMEEAERLCHRIAIIDHGKIIALDTPRNLVAMVGAGLIQVGLAQFDEGLRQQIVALSQVRAVSVAPLPGSTDGLPAQPGAASTRQVVQIETRNVNEALLQLIQLFNQLHLEILSLETLEPNLESVFLYLTGKSLRE